MNACSRSLLTMVLACLVGCADFAREEQEFCERSPQQCASRYCPSGLMCPEDQLCAANQDVCLKTPCGNGFTEAKEVCDDGNILDGDGCSKDCSSDERCGNNKVDLEVGEVCDEGDTLDGDGCSADCKSTELCGNGVVDTALGEVCDDKNNQPGDGCSANCRSNETCGNNVIDDAKGEVCDDGDNDSGDGCSTDCRSSEGCGNGTLESGELCDDRNWNNDDNCVEIDNQCVPARCGDGLVDRAVPGVEECDSENRSQCDLDCTLPVCGDSIINPSAGEECEVPSVGASTSVCNSDCTPSRCGDGKPNSIAGESCDDGNTTTETSCPYGTPNCIRCDASCTTVLNLVGGYCGDNIQNGNEVCDDGNNTTETSCPYGSASCTWCDATCSTVLNLSGPYCGDGITNGSETCDDGNADACGTCNVTCSRSQLAPATGLITIEDVSEINDGFDTIILDDGIHPAVIFEFDRNGTYSPNNIPIPYATSNTCSEVATSLANAINSVGTTLAITAVVPTFSRNVNLTHDLLGTRGNRSISTTAVTTGPSASLTVSGMSGGGGHDCPSGTGCVRNEDCDPNLVCRPDRTCGVPLQ
jgi:cysteine-rich repeat protein